LLHRNYCSNLLLALLPADKHETISGDLHEAYAERHLQMGSFSANAWYVLQVFSFIPHACVDAYAHNPLLALVCIFTAASGTWLGTMSILLGHDHLVRSESIAGTIVAQALLTLAVLPLRHISCCAGLRWPVACQCCILPLARCTPRCTARIQKAYILLIAMALVVQSVLTAIAMFRQPKQTATA